MSEHVMARRLGKKEQAKALLDTFACSTFHRGNKLLYNSNASRSELRVISSQAGDQST